MYEISAEGVTWKRHIDQIRDSIHPITEKTVKTDTSVVSSLPNIHTPSVLERNMDTPPPCDTSVSPQTSSSDNIDKRVTVQCAIPESSIVLPEYVPGTITTTSDNTQRNDGNLKSESPSENKIW